MEELVEMLEMNSYKIVEIREDEMSKMKYIINIERNKNFNKKKGYRMKMIIDVKGDG
jgi:hypothetical protein